MSPKSQVVIEFLNASMRTSVVGVLLTVPLWAGQSLRLNGSQTASNGSVAAQGVNSPCRVEFQLTTPSTSAFTVMANVNACGIQILYNTGFLQVYSLNATGWSCCNGPSVGSFTSNWLLFRYQQIPSGAGGTLTWEAWDINGVRQYSHTETYTGTSGSNSNGTTIGSAGNQDA